MRRLVFISQGIHDTPKVFEKDLDQESPYTLVEQARENLDSLKQSDNRIFAEYKISDVAPIHNISGIRDLTQVEQMQGKIKKGLHITEADGMPNVKLIVAPNNKLLLFDGTHTLLAYYFAGKILLGEVPHLIICGEDFSTVTPEEISYFFPKEAREKVTSNWENYAVNWQAEIGEQLETRKVRTLGQLATQLSKRDKSSIE